jgi:hypothetical protein
MSKWDERSHDGKEGTGPNMVVAFSVLALGLLGAIGVAVAIIYPFYLRR